MSLPRPLLILPVAALFMAACGDDSGATDTSAATTLMTPDTTAAGPSGMADTTVAGTAAADTTPVTAIDGPVQIDVVVGVDSGPDRIERVKVGSDVTLNITNPDAADSYHVHEVELEQDVDKGVTATFNFVADTPGTIEVESHVTEKVLVVIEVG